MRSLWRLPLTSRRSMFSFARKSVWQLPPVSSVPQIPKQEVVDEELCPQYSSADYYPANPGEILARRFQLLVKIGWGAQSTVWLARDISRFKWQDEDVVALKIINKHSGEEARHEREIERHIAQKSPEHRGCGILRTSVEDISVAGPRGTHMCLVYEPMREPLWIFKRRFVDRQIPLPLAKAYIYFLLVGLDYLHSDCRVVHTDLKLDNILMTFENENVFTNFVEQQRQQPMEYKIEDEYGRTVYRCHNDFGALHAGDIKNMVTKLADFGQAIRLDQTSPPNPISARQMGLYPIQPDYFRAPEVILGCGWDFKADIWNLGVLLWNVIGTKELFQQVHDSSGRYSAKAHLAEMIALLGPPPKELLTRSRTMSDHGWPGPIVNDAGRACNNALEFFAGPFFNAEDEFCYDELVPSRSLKDSTPFLEAKDQEAFLSFVRDMLTWLPEERKTAGELIDHPFLRIKD